jgi:DNA-binding HxlR family transcriptional regulator
LTLHNAYNGWSNEGGNGRYIPSVKIGVFTIMQKGGGKNMQRSKLKICNEILWTLASKGPMKSPQLATHIEISKTRLEQHLRLLKNRNLVERQRLGKGEIFYVVTERGMKVLKIMGPIIEEARKLQALQV